MILGGGNDHDEDDATRNLKSLDDVPLLNGEGGSNNNNNMPLLGGTSILGSSGAIPSSTVGYLQLRIKSFTDVTVYVPNDSNVSYVKDAVRAALGPQSHDRYLRLICKGRLLYPDESPISEFMVHNNDVIHAVLAAAGVRGPSSSSSSSSSTRSSVMMGGSVLDGGDGGTNNNRRRRGGTIIGPGGRVTRAPTTSSSPWSGGGGEDSSSSAGSDDDDDVGGVVVGGGPGDAELGTTGNRQQHRRMGFDRLRGSGLSRQEITAIRTYFNRHVDRHVQMHGMVDHQDEPDLRRRRLLFEEDWMSLQGPTSEFRLNLNQNTLLRFASVETNWRASLGTDRDFMWGFLLGFFVGFCMLVWVWMPTVPHKQKIGILTGISFQLAMNVLRNDDEYDNEEDFVEGD